MPQMRLKKDHSVRNVHVLFCEIQLYHRKLKLKGLFSCKTSEHPVHLVYDAAVSQEVIAVFWMICRAVQILRTSPSTARWTAILAAARAQFCVACPPVRYHERPARPAPAGDRDTSSGTVRLSVYLLTIMYPVFSYCLVHSFQIILSIRYSD